jgi:hypothetical protein
MKEYYRKYLKYKLKYKKLILMQNGGMTPVLYNPMQNIVSIQLKLKDNSHIKFEIDMDKTDSIYNLVEKLNIYLKTKKHKMLKLYKTWSDEINNYDTLIGDYTTTDILSFVFTVRKLSDFELEDISIEKIRLKCILNQIEHTLKSTISRDFPESDKRQLILFYHYSGNIQPEEIKKNILQGLNINAVNYAHANNYQLIIFNLDELFLENLTVLQTNDYLDMELINIPINITDSRCIPYNVSIKGYKLRHELVDMSEHINIFQYHDYLRYNLGSGWYTVLKSVNLVIFNVGIHIGSYLNDHLSKGLISKLSDTGFGKNNMKPLVGFKHFSNDFDHSILNIS